jgi:hypothetical protein
MYRRNFGGTCPVAGSQFIAHRNQQTGVGNSRHRTSTPEYTHDFFAAGHGSEHPKEQDEPGFSGSRSAIFIFFPYRHPEKNNNGG